MRQTVISRKVGARMMTNPHPSHVSLVKAGANQQAFHAIRSALNTEDDMKINRAKSATVATAIPAGFGVVQFQFDAATFKTEEDVARWLDDGGYADYSIQPIPTGFTVSADANDFAPGTVKKIDGAIPGVVVYAGEYTEAAKEAQAASEGSEGAEGADDADSTTAERSDQQVSEEPGQSDPAAPGSAEGGVQPVATLGEDIGEVIERADEVLRQRGIYEIDEIGSMVNRLAWIVYDAEWSDIPEATVTKIKGAASSLLEAFVELSTDYAEQLREFFANHSSVERSEQIEEPAAPEPVEPQAPAPSALDADAIAALVGKIVSDGLAPIAASVEALTSQVETVQSEVSATKTALDTRVGALESQGQTRKGADHVDPPEQQPAKRSEGSNNILRAMGSRHAE